MRCLTCVRHDKIKKTARVIPTEHSDEESHAANLLLYNYVISHYLRNDLGIIITNYSAK